MTMQQGSLQAWRIMLTLHAAPSFRFRHLRAFAAQLAEPDADAVGHHQPVKPFTVSPLHTSDDGDAWIDVTTLTRAAGSALQRGVRQARSRPRLKLGDTPLSIPCDAQRLATTDFAELLEQPPSDTVDLRFHSPVVFLHGRNGTSCFPTPGLVFGHHRSRWNTFAPPDLQLHLDLRALDVVVTSFEGRSAEVTVGFRRGQRHVDRRFAGFVGTAAYSAQRRDQTAQTAWQAAAAFSRFCGTGSNTTMGLGVTTPAPNQITHHMKDVG